MPTLPRELARRGYRCLQTGKYWEGHWRNAGFTEGMTTAEPSGGKYGDKVLANGEVVAHGNGDHGLAIGRETIQPIHDFIDDCGDAPFLVWYAPFLPHTPHNSPQRYIDLYKNRKGVPEHRIPYYAAISQFDATVGQLVDAIASRGLAENTILVFVVDNGWEPDVNRPLKKSGEWDHTNRSKRAPFEYGLRTPILIRWNGKNQSGQDPRTGKQYRHCSDVAAGRGHWYIGAQITWNQFTPIRFGPEITLAKSGIVWRNLSRRCVVVGKTHLPTSPTAGYGAGNFKLIVPHFQDGKPPWNKYLMKPALFDVVADPDESNNITDHQEHPTTVTQLRELLDRWWSPEK